ncbi:ankyrin repeat domain-containing protein 50-like isoform X2 [Corticium candelabrum]|nr:ankyrin repeat domain-containing protein 50-like isoform X2 [Corticium candelabrum]
MNEEFMKAVERGDSITYITCLLNMGVDINTHDEYGNTLLIQACLNKNKEMVEFLLTKSADVNGAGEKGWTALIVAVLLGCDDIVEVLLNVKDVNVMKKDDGGMTAIHHAAMWNHVIIVERLLSCSVPADINDNIGCTPLCWAACLGHVCCVDVLLKHGASPKHKSELLGSPLEIAKEKGHSDVVEMMKEAIRLTSHPYVEGRMSVMRHQYQQTIAQQESEIMRLRTATADTFDFSPTLDP